jgi:hypothetical protein
MRSGLLASDTKRHFFRMTARASRKNRMMSRHPAASVLKNYCSYGLGLYLTSSASNPPS